MKICITGASGAVGRRLAGKYLESGHQVRGIDIARMPRFLEGLSAFGFTRGDIGDGSLLEQVMRGCDAAVHCAALLPRDNHLGREAFVRANAGGAVAFLKACIAAHIPRAVIISTTGVLRPSGGGVIYDDAPYRSRCNPYEESKIIAEQRIDELKARDKIRYVILRPSAIYGSGMYYKWSSLFKMARKGMLFTVGDGRGRYSVIHVDDLCDAVECALERLERKSSGEKITVTSGESLSIKQVLSVIAGGRKVRRIPYSLALAGSYLTEGAARVTHSRLMSSITPVNIRDYASGLCFDPAKAQRLIGFRAKRLFGTEIVRVMEDYLRESPREKAS